MTGYIKIDYCNFKSNYLLIHSPKINDASGSAHVRQSVEDVPLHVAQEESQTSSKFSENNSKKGLITNATPLIKCVRSVARKTIS